MNNCKAIGTESVINSSLMKNLLQLRPAYARMCMRIKRSGGVKSIFNRIINDYTLYTFSFLEC